MAKATSDATYLSLTKIVRDADLQPRAVMSTSTIEEYMETLIDKGEEFDFPPVTVFKDEDGVYWLGDGFHRCATYEMAKRKKIPCKIKTGSKRDAWLHSLGVNAKHGLRRTNADKQAAVTKALTDKEIGKWSDNRIAELCNVSGPLVGHIRSTLEPRERNGRSSRVGKDGRVRSVPEERSRPAREVESPARNGQAERASEALRPDFFFAVSYWIGELKDMKKRFGSWKKALASLKDKERERMESEDFWQPVSDLMTSVLGLED